LRRKFKLHWLSDNLISSSKPQGILTLTWADLWLWVEPWHCASLQPCGIVVFFGDALVLRQSSKAALAIPKYGPIRTALNHSMGAELGSYLRREPEQGIRA